MTHGLSTSYVSYHGQVLKAQGQSHLVEKLSKNLGFGMGLEFRESALMLTPKNEGVVRAGMVFNVCIGVQGLENPETKDPKKKVRAWSMGSHEYDYDMDDQRVGKEGTGGFLPTGPIVSLPGPRPHVPYSCRPTPSRLRTLWSSLTRGKPLRSPQAPAPAPGTRSPTPPR